MVGMLGVVGYNWEFFQFCSSSLISFQLWIRATVFLQKLPRLSWGTLQVPSWFEGKSASGKTTTPNKILSCRCDFRVTFNTFWVHFHTMSVLCILVLLLVRRWTVLGEGVWTQHRCPVSYWSLPLFLFRPGTMGNLYCVVCNTIKSLRAFSDTW